MKDRLLVLITTLSVCAFACGAFAQEVRPAAVPPRAPLNSDPQEISKRRMDFMYFALANAPDEQTAGRAAQYISAQWMRSRSDTINLLMERVQAAKQQKDIALTLELLTNIVEINPRFFEARAQRAEIYFLQQRYADAMEDLYYTLQREPRHFGAWVGVGMILLEFGYEKRALDAFTMALALHPYMEKVPEMYERLRLKVHGQPI